jgi:hypothetical protein
MPVLMLVGLLALGFGAGAALPQLTRTLSGDRAAKVSPGLPARADAAHRGPAQGATDSSARCDQQPNLDRQCRNDTAAASGDPSPPRTVAADRNADGSPRTKADVPAAPSAPASAAPPTAPPAQAAPTSRAGNAEPANARDAEGASQETEQVSVPQQRTEPQRERRVGHRHGGETRRANREERKERQAAPSGEASPSAQASADTPDATQSRRVGAPPKADQSRRAERSSRDTSRHSKRYRSRDSEEDTRTSSRDRDDDSRRSGRDRERNGDDELSADANERPRGAPPPSSNPFPFFPFFGQSSW